MANRLIRYDAAAAAADPRRRLPGTGRHRAAARHGGAWPSPGCASGSVPRRPACRTRRSGSRHWPAPLAFAWQRLARLRLAHLAEHSPIASSALERRSRLGYFCLAHALAAPLLLAAAGLIGSAAGRPAAALGIAILAYGAGAGLGQVMPGSTAARRDGRGLDRARRSARERPPRRAGFDRAAAGRRAGTRIGPGRPDARRELRVHLAAGWWGEGRPEALRFALLLSPSFLLLLMAARLDAGLLAFLPAAGFGPGFSAFAVSALPAALASSRPAWR